jgi:hypothetical protein
VIEESKEDGAASKPNKSKNPEAKHWKRDYDNLNQHDKMYMRVDEIFALYLFKTSRKTND